MSARKGLILDPILISLNGIMEFLYYLEQEMQIFLLFSLFLAVHHLSNRSISTGTDIQFQYQPLNSGAQVAIEFTKARKLFNSKYKVMQYPSALVLWKRKKSGGGCRRRLWWFIQFTGMEAPKHSLRWPINTHLLQIGPLYRGEVIN